MFHCTVHYKTLSQKFHREAADLIKPVLTNTYLYGGSFFRQEDGVAIGFPLTPVVASFYMKHFEQTAISTAIYKPTRWCRYVKDTFVV